ncbi:gypsy retrotransposon integrase-like protein 1 [Plakobranchus ocellatus]|uniref:Gypsy retrotransposon integrase-like protein 1 n=1 Tax=Plakobranchus ocellatus TaxID=259542 RepID=A0AAV3YEQ2_9GAST|nr:gypsy retrotransposon integrase-like protein 1 [Plakobranchus ocellatus]
MFVLLGYGSLTGVPSLSRGYQVCQKSPLRVIRDGKERENVVSGAHTGLGDSVESNALGRHLGLIKRTEFDLFQKYQELALKLRVPDEKLLELVESKVQADLDVQEKKLRAEEGKLARARELAEAEEKKLKAQTAALEAKKLLDVTAGTPTPHPNYAKPKLPPLTEFSQVDLYLQRFENYAKSMKWQPGDYASCLANLLQGEALSVFLSLSPEDISDYQSVKKTLFTQEYNCCIEDAKFNRDGRLHIESASLFGSKCSLLRDTGCNTVGVRRSLVPVSSITGRRIKVNTFCCKNRAFDTAVIDISSPYFSGRVEACLLTNPVADVILGDIDGIIHPTPSNSYSDVDGPVPSACVVTRSQARKTIDNNSQNNMVPSYDLSTQSQLIPTPLNCVPLADVGSRQKVDPTLKDWFNKVGAPPVGGVYFTITEGKLLRHYQRAGSDIINTTMAVPESLRHLVLQCAHDNCLSGRSGFKKTLSNVQAYFSWPGISKDVRCYTRSCHVCQVRPRVRSDRPAPFQPVTLVEIPFQRVIIDIIGPLPVSQNRYEYILILVDLSTRWAEGVPLRHISAKDVAQSLFDLFCRLGFDTVG